MSSNNDKKEENFLKKWKELRQKVDTEETSISELSFELGIPRNNLLHIAIGSLKEIMDKVEDISIFKDEVMIKYGLIERDFDYIAEKADFKTTKNKIYTDQRIKLLLRLDPMAIDFIDECIGIYGETRTAVIRRMITDFYTSHQDEIDRVYNR